VAKYCEGCAVPWERKVPERKTPVITDEVVEFIQACLDADEHENLKNQSHTAKRIYDRLIAEKEFSGGESTVRRKVREMKGSRPKVFVPLEFSPGEAVQVDWGEAKVCLRSKKITAQLFCARLCSDLRDVCYYS
jgi:transposase